MSDITENMDLPADELVKAYENADENVQHAVSGLLMLGNGTACFMLTAADLNEHHEAGFVQSGFFIYSAPVSLIDPMLQSVLASMTGNCGREAVEESVKDWLEHPNSEDAIIEAGEQREREDLEPYV